MRRCLALVFVPFALLFAPPARAGDVLKVGPGRDYAGIQEAIDAAHDGDVVLVYGDIHSGFVMPDKSLAIVEAPGANVTVLGEMHVEGQDRHRIVLIASLTARAPTVLNSALRLKQSLAAVRIQDCDLAGYDLTGLGTAGVAANVSFCSDVVFTRSSLRGGDGFQKSYPYCYEMGNGGDACFARSSTVGMFGSTIRGGNGAGDACDDFFDGRAAGHALETPEGFILASGCALEGGAGGWGGWGGSSNPGGNGGPGGDGLRVGTWPQGVGNPEVRLLACQVAGGPGGSPGDTMCPPKECGVASPGDPGMPTRVLNGSSTDVPEPSRRVEGPSIARDGDSITLSFHGNPGDEVELAVRRGRLTGSSVHPRGIGAVPVDGPVHVGAIPAGGVLDWTVVVGDNGPTAAVLMLLEPAFVDVQGVRHTGNSFGLVLADGGAY